MNPLTWQNPEQLFVAQVLKKIFYNSVAELREIRDGRRKFVECTWVKGYTPDSIRILLTVWYEMKKVELCPVDSLEWTEDMEF